MINKKLLWLAPLSLFVAMASCHDSSTDPDEPHYPGLDSFEGRIKEFFLTDETDRFEASDCDIKILAPDHSVISRKCTHRDRSEITNCRVRDSKIIGSKGSLAIGGILGVADMNSRIMLFECHNENSEVAGDYGVGGVMGLKQ